LVCLYSTIKMMYGPINIREDFSISSVLSDMLDMTAGSSRIS
jgi:hypothetical protein